MRQCFAWWSFAIGRDTDEAVALLGAAATIGYRGVEMLPAEMRRAAADAGLAVVTETGHRIEVGFNDRRNHTAVGDEVRASIARAASAGIGAVIVFAGSREDRTDDDGIVACVEGLAPLAHEAGEAGVRLLLEILNSKVDHPDHHCDRSAFAFDVVRNVGHPALRVLFDAYHVQLMEGDLLRTITTNIDLIGHVHTAGVPGRRDLDDRQEVHWPGVAGTLRHLGYDGWVGHELVPRGNPVAALRQAFEHFAR